MAARPAAALGTWSRLRTGAPSRRAVEVVGDPRQFMRSRGHGETGVFQQSPNALPCAHFVAASTIFGEKVMAADAKVMGPSKPARKPLQRLQLCAFDVHLEEVDLVNAELLDEVVERHRLDGNACHALFESRVQYWFGKVRDLAGPRF